MFGAEAKDAFAQCKSCHRDSYRRGESGQRDGMPGQRAHDVGVREKGATATRSKARGSARAIVRTG
jgi:hypothetical protein